MRTETTINDTRDFGIGRRLKNLPELRRIGFAANRRLLEIKHQPRLCAGRRRLPAPATSASDRQSACPRAALRRRHAASLLHTLLMFVFVARGFTNKDLRHTFAACSATCRRTDAGRMSYELRRLRLHGLIERLPKTHRYRLTEQGLRTALFYTRVYSRILRPGTCTDQHNGGGAARFSAAYLPGGNNQVSIWCDEVKLAA